jgi:hypothetical protein
VNGRSSGVRDELEQRAVRVTEVHARALSASSRPLDGPRLDLYLVGAQVLHGLLDRAGPDEAEVAVPGTHRLGRDQAADIRVGAVDVQPLVAEGIGEPAVLERDDLGAEDVAVEGVRATPVADRDDDVVERELQSSRSQ